MWRLVFLTWNPDSILTDTEASRIDWELNYEGSIDQARQIQSLVRLLRRSYCSRPLSNLSRGGVRWTFGPTTPTNYGMELLSEVPSCGYQLNLECLRYAVERIHPHGSSFKFISMSCMFNFPEPTYIWRDIAPVCGGSKFFKIWAWNCQNPHLYFFIKVWFR